MSNEKIYQYNTYKDRTRRVAPIMENKSVYINQFGLKIPVNRWRSSINPYTKANAKLVKTTTAITNNPVPYRIPEKRERPIKVPSIKKTSDKTKKKRGRPLKNPSRDINIDFIKSLNQNSQTVEDCLSTRSATINSTSMNSRFTQNSPDTIENPSYSTNIILSPPPNSNDMPLIKSSNDVIKEYQESYPVYSNHSDFKPYGNDETSEFDTSNFNNQIPSDELEALNHIEESRTPNLNTIELDDIASDFESNDSNISNDISEDISPSFSNAIDYRTAISDNNNHQKTIAYNDSFSIISSETEFSETDNNFSIKENLYSSEQSESENSDEEDLDWKQFPNSNENSSRNILPNIFLEYQPAIQYRSFNYFGKRQFNSNFSASTQTEISNNRYRLIPQGPLYRISCPCKYMPLKHPEYILNHISNQVYANSLYMQSQNYIQYDIGRSKIGEFIAEHLYTEINSLLFKTGVGNCMQLIFKSWLIYVMGESQNQLWILNIHNHSKSFMLVETVQRIHQIYISNSDKNSVSIILRLEVGLIPFRLSYEEIKRNKSRSIYPRPLQLGSPPLDISFNLNDSSEFFVILKNGEFYRGEINLRNFDKLGEISVEEGQPLTLSRYTSKHSSSQLDAEFYLKQENSNSIDQAEENISGEDDSSSEQDEAENSQSDYEPDSDVEESPSGPKLESNDAKPDNPIPQPLVTTRIRHTTNNQLIIFTSYKLYKVRFSTTKTLINPINLPYPTDCLLGIEVIDQSYIVLLTRKYLMILSLHDPTAVQHLRTHLVPASPNSSLSISKFNAEGVHKKQYLITVWSTFDAVPYSYIFTLNPEIFLSQIPFNIPTPHSSSHFREYYKLFNHKFYGFNLNSTFFDKRIGITQVHLDLPQLIGFAARVYSKRYDYNMSIWWLTELGDVYQVNLKWTNEEIPSKLELYSSMQMTPNPYEIQLLSKNFQSELLGNISNFKIFDCTTFIKKLHYLSTSQLPISSEVINQIEQLVPEMVLKKITKYSTLTLSLTQLMEELVQTKVVLAHQLPDILALLNDKGFWRGESISKKITKSWIISPLNPDYKDLVEFDEFRLTYNTESSKNSWAYNRMLDILEISTQVPIPTQDIPRESPPLEPPKPEIDTPYRFKIFHPKMKPNSLKDFVNRLSHRWGSRTMEDPGIVATPSQPIRNIAYLSQPLPPISPLHSQQPTYAQTQPYASYSQQSTYNQPQPYSSNSQQPISSHTQSHSILSQPSSNLNRFGSSTQPITSNLPFSTMSQPAPRSKPVQKKRTRGF